MSLNKENPVRRTSFYVWRAFIVIALAAFFALTVVLTLYVSHFQNPISDSHAVWGQFGDFFGGTLNPIFGLLSLVAILATLFVQTEELAHSSSALKEQSSHLELQAFENTFFSMLQLYRNGISSIELDEKGQLRGPKAIADLKKRLEQEYEASALLNERKSDSMKLNSESLTREAYFLFYNKHMKHLGYSIRVIEQLFEFIKRKAPENNQEQYWKILRAQMSDSEIVILFYHCFSSEKDYFQLGELDSNGFFRYLPPKDLLDPQVHINYLRKDERSDDQ